MNNHWENLGTIVTYIVLVGFLIITVRGCFV